MIRKDSRVKITRGILAGSQGTVLQDVRSSGFTFARGEPWVQVKLDGAELPVLFVTFDLKEILPAAGFGTGHPTKGT
jgi:hypothetical protein